MKEVTKTLTLNSGTEIPAVGFGTSRLSGIAREPILMALAAGYRHIDTATMYNTEEEIGAALAESGVARSEMFLTTKLHDRDQGYETTLAAVDVSLANLQTDYVDLYLVHWPNRESADTRKDTWRAMEEILASGKAKAIGVSNFDIELLEEMKGYATTMPAMNQIEFHPFLIPRETKEYCEKEGIAVTSYSPLTRSKHLDDSAIDSVAQKYGKSPAQILIRWNLQWGNVVIPRSASKAHIEENIAVFDFQLDESDMESLNALDRQESALR
jgi:2,5-diketo-D-gluconate reductase A